jgi:hypothetical protein
MDFNIELRFWLIDYEYFFVNKFLRNNFPLQIKHNLLQNMKQLFTHHSLLDRYRLECALLGQLEDIASAFCLM